MAEIKNKNGTKALFSRFVFNFAHIEKQIRNTPYRPKHPTKNDKSDKSLVSWPVTRTTKKWLPSELDSQIK